MSSAPVTPCPRCLHKASALVADVLVVDLCADVCSTDNSTTKKRNKNKHALKLSSIVTAKCLGSKHSHNATPALDERSSMMCLAAIHDALHTCAANNHACFQHITSIDLSENKLQPSTQLDAMLELVSATMPNLQEVSIRRNEAFTHGGVQALVCTILASPNAHIRRLNLSACSLDDEAVRTLARAPAFKNICTLNLRGNGAITNHGVQSLVDAASNPSACLVEVNINNGSTEHSDDLKRVLHRNTRRAISEQIKCAFNKDEHRDGIVNLPSPLHDEDAEVVAEHMKLSSSSSSSSTTMLGMSLCGARLTDAGVECMVEALRRNTHVVRIITDDGTTASSKTQVYAMHGAAAANRLCASLSKRSTAPQHPLLAGTCNALRSLGGTPLGLPGVCEVVRAIEKSPFASVRWCDLTSLGVHNTDISAAGIALLADALAVHHSLTELVAYSNPAIGDAGAECLATHMKKGSLPLRSLDIGSCGVGDAGACAMASALTAGACVLVELHVDHNAIGDAAAMSLARSVIETGRVHTLWRHGNPGFDAGTLGDDAAAAAECVIPSVCVDDPRAALPGALAAAMARERVPVASSVALDQLDDASMPMSHDDISDGSGGTLGDRIAECAIAAYLRNAGAHALLWRGGQVVLAAFVLETRTSSEAELRCVALGAGTKFIPRGLAKADARANLAAVCDSHAEVLATRMLRRFLWNELRALSFGTRESALAWTSTGVALRDGLRLHLYISTSPCGMASLPATAMPPTCLPCRPGSLCKGTPAKKRVGDWPPPGCAGFARPRACFAAESLSCTDKVYRWLTCGFQGALLSGIIDSPVSVATIVLARKFKPVAAAAWLLPSLSNGVPPSPALVHTDVRLEPALLGAGYSSDSTTVGSRIGDGDECASWFDGLGAQADVHDGRTGLHAPGPMWAHPPHASRAVLIAVARDVLATIRGFDRVRSAVLGVPPPNDPASYRKFKSNVAGEYYLQRKREAQQGLDCVQ